VFSTLDLKSGFWQVVLRKQDRAKCSFQAGNQIYQFRVMPFGVMNGSATFQRLMTKVLGELIGDICFVYCEDVIVYSSSPEQHVEDVRKVLERLRAAGLTLSVEKCRLGHLEVDYLGNVLSAEGRSVQSLKEQAIAQFPQPQSRRELERILGMVTWFNQYMPNLSTIAEPLNRLHRKDVDW
jgi:hypothetical protein